MQHGSILATRMRRWHWQGLARSWMSGRFRNKLRSRNTSLTANVTSPAVTNSEKSRTLRSSQQAHISGTEKQISKSMWAKTNYRTKKTSISWFHSTAFKKSPRFHRTEVTEWLSQFSCLLFWDRCTAGSPVCVRVSNIYLNILNSKSHFLLPVLQNKICLVPQNKTYLINMYQRSSPVIWSQVQVKTQIFEWRIYTGMVGELSNWGEQLSILFIAINFFMIFDLLLSL